MFIENVHQSTRFIRILKIWFFKPQIILVT